MKNIKFVIKPLLLLMTVGVMFTACSEKLDENDGQLATDDLDFTNMSDMILPVYGAYSVTYSRGWEDPLLLGVRGCLLYTSPSPRD